MDHANDLTSDVVVLGGGPAGATVAALVARAGFRVIVLEGKQFPRFHVGESLLSSSLPYLQDLGLRLDGALRQFPAKRYATVVWGRRPDPWILGMPDPGLAHQVDRATFDSLLLSRARELGATVIERAWADQPILDHRGWVQGVTIRRGHEPGTVRSVRARLTVDATGLSMLLTRRLGLSLHRGALKEFAVGGRFTGAQRLDGPHRNDLGTEACQDGWMWFIPISDTITSSGFVGDRRSLTGSPLAVLRHQLESSTWMSKMLASANLVEGPRMTRYGNHIVTSPLWGNGYILAGDSAFFVDPLLSTGVHSALKAAYCAAGAIVEVLTGREGETPLARWYDDTMRRHARRIYATVRVMYSTHPGTSAYWRERRLDHLTAQTAELLASELGATRSRFFSDLEERELIDVPVALSAALAGRQRRSAADELDAITTELALAPEVVSSHGWAPDTDGLARVLRLEHRRELYQEAEVPADRQLAEFLRSLPGSIEQYLTGAAVSAQWLDSVALPAIGRLLDEGLLVRSSDQEKHTHDRALCTPSTRSRPAGHPRG